MTYALVDESRSAEPANVAAPVVILDCPINSDDKGATCVGLRMLDTMNWLNVCSPLVKVTVRTPSRMAAMPITLPPYLPSETDMI